MYPDISLLTKEKKAAFFCGQCGKVVVIAQAVLFLLLKYVSYLAQYGRSWSCIGKGAENFRQSFVAAVFVEKNVGRVDETLNEVGEERILSFTVFCIYGESLRGHIVLVQFVGVIVQVARGKNTSLTERLLIYKKVAHRRRGLCLAVLDGNIFENNFSLRTNCFVHFAFEEVTFSVFKNSLSVIAEYGGGCCPKTVCVSGPREATGTTAQAALTMLRIADSE